MLPRVPSRWTTTAAVVGMIIGSGIFGVTGEVAAGAGSVGAIGFAWLLGGVIAVSGTLALAELAALYPNAGGLYVYLRKAYGPLTAFLFGWAWLIIYPAGYAAVALIFADALSNFVSLGTFGRRFSGAALVLIIAALNYRSVNLGARIQTVATSAKVLALVGLAAAAFVFGHADAGAFAQPIKLLPNTWGGFGLALIPVLFAYDGWAWAAALAGEIREPQRTIPKALLAGVGTVVGLYIIINAAYLYVLPLERVVDNELVAADVMSELVGPSGNRVLSGLVMLTIVGGFSAVFLADPRVFFAMARDRQFFQKVGSVHQRYGTPHVAIALLATVAVVYIFSGTFAQLTEAFILGLWPFQALAVGAVIMLRRKDPEAPRPFRVPGYPVVPIIFLIASILLVGNALVLHTRTSLAGLLVLLAGVPVYYLWHWLERRVGL